MKKKLPKAELEKKAKTRLKSFEFISFFFLVVSFGLFFKIFGTVSGR